MGLAQKYIPHYTYDDWLHWEGRWELIEGIPIALIPSPPPAHQLISAELQGVFKLAITKAFAKNCLLYPTIGYYIKDNTILAPDIIIVCEKITKDLLDFPPKLIVEILTEATKKRDREIKYDYYEQEGVKYYLLVDINKKLIEIYELVSGRYELRPYVNGFDFNIKDDCTISPQLDNVWE
jgi:Uma2 family endonuclease